jgi:hypothetical protein
LPSAPRSGASTGGLQLAVFAKGQLTYGRGEYFSLSDESDQVGLIRRFEGLLKAIPKAAAQTAEALAAARADLPRLERQITATAFAKQERLAAARAQLARLEIDLQPQEKGQAVMKQDQRDEDWQRLDRQTRETAAELLDEARQTGMRAGREWRGGEVYAYPHPGGGIAWGVDGPTHNLHRGVKAGPANPAGLGSYLDGLHRAGSDEAEFHQVFSRLKGDAGLDDKAVTAIAGAYCGADEDWAERGAALGAIETHFYQQRDQPQIQQKRRQS